MGSGHQVNPALWRLAVIVSGPIGQIPPVESDDGIGLLPGLQRKAGETAQLLFWLCNGSDMLVGIELDKGGARPLADVFDRHLDAIGGGIRSVCIEQNGSVIAELRIGQPVAERKQRGGSLVDIA